MKKTKNYAWLAVLIVMLMAAVPSVLPSAIKSSATKKGGSGCFDRPCAYGLCQWVGRNGEMHDCCAADAGGLCLIHKPTTPQKP